MARFRRVLQGPLANLLLISVSCVIVVLIWNSTHGTEDHRRPYTEDHKLTERAQVLPSRETVRDCITNDLLGALPANMPARVILSQSNFIQQSPELPEDRKQSFQNVFKRRIWGGGPGKDPDEFVASGRGSTLSSAQEYMATLHLLVSNLKKSLGKSRLKMLDIPCGDMQWMSRFLMTRDDIDYTGVDIVPDIINHHHKVYKAYPWKFRLMDILKYPLNESFDIISCRMLLQHLYSADALNFLNQFSKSGSGFLLTTTFPNIPKNAELRPTGGRYRRLNLEIPPISLSPPLCLHIDGLRRRGTLRDTIGLWKLPLFRIENCQHSLPVHPRKFNDTFYSCVDWSIDSS